MERSARLLMTILLSVGYLSGMCNRLLCQTNGVADAAHSNTQASLSFDHPKLVQIGVAGSGGFPVAYNIQNDSLQYGLTLRLFNAEIVGGKILTGPRLGGVFRGRPEAMLEVIPIWVAYYPHQVRKIYYKQYPEEQPAYSPFGPFTSYGASVTPFLLRWNFLGFQNGSHPWLQLGGGLLWTNHKFPLLGGNTSVINFTPQFGLGWSKPTKKDQSLDFAVKAVHISNAGLGDHNPGINVTLQFSLGYSWWK